ncbi:MAG TPA: ATP-binding protein, partial [Oscillatoriaceae cyanobacterium M33_DOE_052]|nr:ATP-binding protein [Oscillatoriaceae cyanobacterium M33_DOE_052]
MTINFSKSRQFLRSFKFTELFVNELGWNPPSSQRKYPLTADDITYSRLDVAELSGVRVFEITSPDGSIPPAKTRAVLAAEISQICLENLIIFTDNQRHQSIWYWGKRDGMKTQPREHIYIKHQPGDLLLGKISALKFTLADFEAGKDTVFDIAQRLHKGFDVEKVTKKFFNEFAQIHQTLLENINGIEPEKDRRWYASVILNRLMFVYFLQRKGFLDKGDINYLQHKLAASQEKGENLYYSQFLPSLFFEGFAKPEAQRDPETQKLIGQIKYLNGGLFLKHPIEQNYPQISIPDSAFATIFRLFESYSWNLDDTTGGKDNEINPAILGYIFEKYINQKEFGAYYTRNEITEYLCDRTINQLIIDAVNPHPPTPSPKAGEGAAVLPSPILGEGP